MKKLMFFVWLAVAPLCFCGCEQFTDSISNQTAYPVRVKVTFAGGVVNDHLEVWGTNYPNSGIVLRRPARVESLEAFDSSGKKIGDISRDEIPRGSKEYGKHIAYVIFDDGIFPVAKSCWQPGSNFVSEDQVKSVYKSEAGQ
jgi:hypothetical protein